MSYFNLSRNSTIWESDKTQGESQEVSPFQAGDHKAARTRLQGADKSIIKTKHET